MLFTWNIKDAEGAILRLLTQQKDQQLHCGRVRREPLDVDHAASEPLIWSGVPDDDAGVAAQDLEAFRLIQND